jgi:hypothetical protein
MDGGAQFETEEHDPVTKARPKFGADIKQAILRVDQGRGFVVEDREEVLPWPVPREPRERVFCDRRLVITAAHCLPYLPKPAEQLGGDATFRNLLGALGSSKPKVWAECLFADPIGDVAVLGVPDSQSLEEQADAYEELMSSVPALRVKKARRKEQAWVLGLDGEWISVRTDWIGQRLWLDLVPKPGMSGSPVVASSGAAIGLLSQGAKDDDRRLRALGGGQPVFWDCLPQWLYQNLQNKKAESVLR